MLVGSRLSWASHCLKVQNKSGIQSCDVEESRHLHLQPDASEQSVCMWSAEMFGGEREMKAEEFLGRTFTISIPPEA